MRPARTPPANQAGSSRDWLGLAARIAVGLVFIVSGTLKASTPAEEFSVVIEAYNILPVGMSLTMATFLPWAELLIGFSLLFGYFSRRSAAAAGTLFLCFIGALLSAKARGIELPNCGCFGTGFHPSTTTTLAMDIVLSGLTVLAYQNGACLLSLDNWVDGTPNP